MPLSPISLLLLAYLFLLLPWTAYRSSRLLTRLRAHRDAADAAGQPSTPILPSPARIYLNTLVNMAVLLTLACLAAREVGVDLFAVPRFGARELTACFVWFNVSFAVAMLSRLWRSPQELRAMPWLMLVPRTRNDWLAFTACAVAAGVCEEAAYRGMGYNAVRWWIGEQPYSAPAAALLIALAFALAHWVQGWKSMVIVFVKGLLLQALVWQTGTLVGAMVGHAVMDMVLAYRSLGLVRRLEAEGPAT
ncbi:MAG: CPBP family intramembrane glutamic endopeptidase [Gemmatimonas sp.]